MEKNEYLWRERRRKIFGLPLSFTVYAMDEERLFVESGFFTKRSDEVRLYRIMDISLTRSLGQRLFGLGTIHVVSSDRTMKSFDIKNIKHAKDIKEAMSKQVEEERTKKRVSSREFMMANDEDDDSYDEEDNDN